MIITLWWKTGAGKGTLAKRLAQYLWYESIGIGDIKRNLAKEMNITIAEWDRIWRTNPEKVHEYDLKFEEYQKSLSLDDNIVLDGRMAFWCQPDGYNIFLDVTDDEWARRVFDAQRDSDARGSFEEVLETNTKRNAWARERYIKLYNVDMYDLSQYNLVIDTTALTPDQIFDMVVQWYKNFLDN